RRWHGGCPCASQIDAPHHQERILASGTSPTADACGVLIQNMKDSMLSLYSRKL
ncbi:hypothetical protein M378DRAFT_173031, partial [Amanita muscaria Koide BX008]